MTDMRSGPPSTAGRPVSGSGPRRGEGECGVTPGRQAEGAGREAGGGGRSPRDGWRGLVRLGGGPSRAGGSRWGGRRLLGRVGRSVGYDVGLVPVGVVAMVGAVGGRGDSVHQLWRKLARFQGAGEPVRLRRPRAVSSFLHGLVSVALGLLSWFLVALLVMAVVRGPFYGFVEQGPYGPGTWGGPTRAGAWAVHAAVAVPMIVLLPFVLRGVGLLQAAFIRRHYGSAVSRLVLPATILLAVGGALFFYSWTQQL